MPHSFNDRSTPYLLTDVMAHGARAKDDDIRLGLYVVVSDLEISKPFYEKLFGATRYFEHEGFGDD